MKIIHSLFLALIAACQMSCGQSTTPQQPSDITDSLSAMDTSIEAGVVSEAGGGPEKVNLPNEFDEEAIMLSLENYFNQEEVNRYKNLEFMGLFYDSTARSYHLRKTITSFVETGIIYDDGSKSFECGVVRNNHESCLFLFSNTYLQQEQKGCINLIGKPHFFKAGEHLNFRTKEQDYLLSASDYVVEPEGSQTHLDYKLILKGQTKSGTPAETLLSFIPWFDDGAVTVLFIGDLDGDTYPDFIIDNAHKYTGVSQSGVLYLTKASAVKGLPKPLSKQVQGSIERPESNGELGC
jgi:hypothetical protein